MDLSKIIVRLFTPAVTIAFFTAVVGPIIISTISSSLEEIKIEEAKLQKEIELESAELKNQKELQHSILLKIMEIASSEGTDIKSLEKLGLLTSFINDNQPIFGLKFSYITQQLKDKQRADRDRLQTELVSKKSEIVKQNDTIRSLDTQSALIKKEKDALKENLEWHKINRKENQALQADMSNRLKDKESDLKTVEEQKGNAKRFLSILTGDLSDKKIMISELTSTIASLTDEKDMVISKVSNQLKNKENEYIELREKYSALEIDRDMHIKKDSQLQSELENKEKLIASLNTEIDKLRKITNNKFENKASKKETIKSDKK